MTMHARSAADTAATPEGARKFIESAETRFHFRHEPSAIRFNSDVRGDGDHVSAKGCRQLAQLVLGPSGDNKLRAGLSELHRQRSADAARRTGDENASPA